MYDWLLLNSFFYLRTGQRSKICFRISQVYYLNDTVKSMYLLSFLKPTTRILTINSQITEKLHSLVGYFGLQSCAGRVAADMNQKIAFEVKPQPDYRKKNRDKKFHTPATRPDTNRIIFRNPTCLNPHMTRTRNGSKVNPVLMES